jgi:hypothetical protein
MCYFTVKVFFRIWFYFDPSGLMNKALLQVKIKFASKLNPMSNIRITKQFSFETGHALYGYDGNVKCSWT